MYTYTYKLLLLWKIWSSPTFEELKKLDRIRFSDWISDFSDLDWIAFKWKCNNWIRSRLFRNRTGFGSCDVIRIKSNLLVGLLRPILFVLFWESCQFSDKKESTSVHNFFTFLVSQFKELNEIFKLVRTK